MTLRNWLETHEFVLDKRDLENLADRMDEDGVEASHTTADWSLFFGDGFVIENTIQGTRIDTVGRYAVTSWPTYCEVRDVSPDVDSGMTPEEVSYYVRELGTKVVLVEYDE